MSITIGSHIFDVVSYDAGGDVLYLHTREPDGAVDFDETPEGHALRFGADGQVVGLTIVRPRALLERHGKLEITLPVRQEHVELSADTLDLVLLAA
jgi:uncharacterized protein YuzE